MVPAPSPQREEGRAGVPRPTSDAARGTGSAHRPTNVEGLAQTGAVAVLAALAWLGWTVAHGFTLTNDSVSYAALAQAFDAGHPFTSTIYWLIAQPGRLQAVWPPLYPALVAVVHAVGASLPRSEWVVDGSAYIAAVTLGAGAIRVAAGRLSWAAVVICALWPAGLLVAGNGWSEPVMLAALGLQFWLAAGAARAAEAGRPRAWLLFAQGAAAGMGFLARYATVPFLGTAVVWGPAVQFALESGSGRPLRARLADALRAALPGLAGVALPVVPWLLAAWAGAGRIGAPYVPLGDGLVSAAHYAAHVAVAAGLGMYVAAPAARNTHGSMLAATALALATAAATLTALLATRRRGSAAAAEAAGRRPLWLLCGLLVADGVLYTAFLVLLRSRYYFDQIDSRLMIPALFPLLLAAVGVAALLPGRLPRAAWLGPVFVLSLWTGWRTATAAIRHPQLAASLHPVECSEGPQGDCSLFSWIEQHTGPSTLIVSNAAYPIWFTTQRPVEALTPYPYAPRVTASEVASWTRRWGQLHPGAQVLLVLDGARGWLTAAGPEYGAYVADAWQSTAEAPGLAALPIVSGPEYRVWRLETASVRHAANRMTRSRTAAD